MSARRGLRGRRGRRGRPGGRGRGRGGPGTLSPWRRRLPLVLGLTLLAPVCAEYLIGYDDNVGDPGRLLGDLLIFCPLYGAAAVLIREIARRLVGPGRAGWPTMLLFAAAFGVIEAGLIDQSLFNDSYRDIDYWDAMLRPTYVAGLGLGLHPTLTFVVGHTVWSFGAPIALVEALAGPLARRPWLGRPGLVVAGALYALAAWVVFRWHVRTEHFLASPGQLTATAAVAAALLAGGVVAALRPPTGGRAVVGNVVVGNVVVGSAVAPRPVVAGGCAFAAFGVYALTWPTWIGVALAVLALTVLAALLLRWSRRPGWGPRHRLAVAGAPLVLYAVLAFAAQPLGDVEPGAKYAHNAALAIGVVTLLWSARLRLGTTPVKGSPGS